MLSGKCWQGAGVEKLVFCQHHNEYWIKWKSMDGKSRWKFWWVAGYLHGIRMSLYQLLTSCKGESSNYIVRKLDKYLVRWWTLTSLLMDRWTLCAFNMMPWEDYNTDVVFKPRVHSMNLIMAQTKSPPERNTENVNVI